MTYQLEPISESQFLEFNPLHQLLTDPNARCFAQLNLGPGLGYVAIGWCSDLVTPELYLNRSQQQIWIGVDRTYVVLSTATGHILLKQRLSTNILKFVSDSDWTAVLSETEIQFFNFDLTLYFSQVLPDLANHVSIQGNYATITTLEGADLVFDLSTGNLKPKVNQAPLVLPPLSSFTRSSS